jgi:hypothetical protein
MAGDAAGKGLSEEICKEIVDISGNARWFSWVDGEVTQDNKQSFEEWFGGLMWADPYPDYEEIARIAWNAALQLNQPK